jgi:hypothetical protein
MNESEPELVHRERSSTCPVVVAGLIFLPLLYVLSPPFLVLFLRPGQDHLYMNFTRLSSI